MKISFHCPSCHSRFDVDASLAGRKGKCKHCGGRLEIPSAVPAELASVGDGGGVAVRANPRPKTWVEAVNSNVGLAPISMTGMRPAARNAMVQAALVEDPHPEKLSYSLASAPAVKAAAATSKPVGIVKRVYRREIGLLQRILRWVSESAYFVSVPFLLLILIGVVMHNRPLALFAATIAILLNIGRFVTGMAYLLAIPFKEGIFAGIFFLIPPFTFFYIAQHWSKLQRPLKRIAEPALTIVLVVLAFAFIPWLSSDGKSDGSLLDRAKNEANILKSEVQGQAGGIGRSLEKVATDIQQGNTADLKSRGEDALKQIQGKFGSPSDPQRKADQ
jgi:predicted Zn finger-like uncharacterized protein